MCVREGACLVKEQGAIHKDINKYLACVSCVRVRVLRVRVGVRERRKKRNKEEKHNRNEGAELT